MTDDKQKKGNGGITSTFYAIEKSLKTYLMRFLVRPQDIEDTVQETFIRAYEAQKTSEIRSPKSFLYKIATNLALTEVTRKSSKMMVTMRDMDELDVIFNNSILEDELAVQQFLDSLNGAIDSLPPKCRTVLIMRKVYGFSHKEIAQRLGISFKTVERHLHKALMRCHKVATGQDGAVDSEVPYTEKNAANIYSIAARDE